MKNKEISHIDIDIDIDIIDIDIDIDIDTAPTSNSKIRRRGNIDRLTHKYRTAPFPGLA